MPATCDIGGEIRVALGARSGAVTAVRIASSRPTEAARVFEGLAPEALCGRIGQVFSLCGKAQTVAALRAAEAALGFAPAPGVEAARDLARLAEMFTQTLMRLALHWPGALGLGLRPELVRAGLALEARLAEAALGPDWRVPGAGTAAPGPGVAQALAAAGAALDAGADLAATLRAALAGRGIEGYGALPAGLAPEQGALARNWAAPGVARARAAHGAGLAARLEAALSDLDRLPGEMGAALAAIAPTPARAPARAQGAGAATVETARGPLTHRVEIAGGQVRRCRTEAPTEANFAAGGPLALGLIGAPADPVAARLHVLAIDPCVAVRVEIEPEAGGI